MIEEIQTDIDNLLDEIGSDTKLVIRGNEYSMKATLIDQLSIRQRGDLPDWFSKSEEKIYVSFGYFLSLGLLRGDIKDIEKVYYLGQWYRVMGAIHYGMLENSAAYIFMGLAK